jgi:hypothetical protein
MASGIACSDGTSAVVVKGPFADEVSRRGGSVALIGLGIAEESSHGGFNEASAGFGGALLLIDGGAGVVVFDRDDDDEDAGATEGGGRTSALAWRGAMDGSALATYDAAGRHMAAGSTEGRTNSGFEFSCSPGADGASSLATSERRSCGTVVIRGGLLLGACLP